MPHVAPEQRRDEETAITPEMIEGAIDELAERLVWALEKYDPSDTLPWDELDFSQKEIYRAAIRSLLCCERPLAMALTYNRRLTRNDKDVQ